MSRPHWSNRLAFILAASGSAIGLGNIWKFPYITGMNGGGAFVLIYLLCIVGIGVPVLLAEMYIGRESQSNAVDAFKKLHHPKTPFKIIGFMGILSAFFILSFYSVVGGWILDFEYRALFNQFSSLPTEAVSHMLEELFGNPIRLIFGHSIFMILTVTIVASGVTDGIERWSRILMPSLFVLLILFLIYSFFQTGFSEAMTFLFKPDFSKLTAEGALEAIGHSFFTLSLGMAAMITYGSYLPKKEGLFKTALTLAALDTMIALIAGIIIFTIVFSHNQAPGSGPALMFVTLPLIFKEIPGGNILAIFFFLLVSFAALTSAISILEVVIAYFTERFEKLTRRKTAIIFGLFSWFIGIFCALSFNTLGEFKIIGKYTIFDTLDKLTSSITLPLGGLLIALFFGWILGKKAIDFSIEYQSKTLKFLILWSARLVAPAAILILLIRGILGIIEN